MLAGSCCAQTGTSGMPLGKCAPRVLRQPPRARSRSGAVLAARKDSWSPIVNRWATYLATGPLRPWISGTIVTASRCTTAIGQARLSTHVRRDPRTRSPNPPRGPRRFSRRAPRRYRQAPTLLQRYEPRCRQCRPPAVRSRRCGPRPRISMPTARSASQIAAAQRTARPGPSKVARTPSPVDLIRRPRCRSISWLTSASWVVSSSRHRRSPRPAACSVEPTTSVNTTVASTRSTWWLGRSPVRSSSMESSITVVSPAENSRSLPASSTNFAPAT